MIDEQPAARTPHAFARTPLPSSFLVALMVSLSFPEQISGSLWGSCERAHSLWPNLMFIVGFFALQAVLSVNALPLPSVWSWIDGGTQHDKHTTCEAVLQQPDAALLFRDGIAQGMMQVVAQHVPPAARA